MILWNDTVAMGDTLCSFPTMVQIIANQRKRFPDLGVVELAFTNQDVGTLFPLERYNCALISTEEALGRYPSEPLNRISVHEMVLNGAHMGAKYCHPSTAFVAHMGFPELSDAPLKPDIEFDHNADVPVYDFIISPYILADAARMWSMPKWQFVVDAIVRKFPGARIAVLGTSLLPIDTDLKKLNPYSQTHFYENARKWQRSLNNVVYEFDRPLREVAAMMWQCRKAILTVDSGPSRLVHAVAPGVAHILLCHNSVPIEWGSYPGAHTIYADMHTLTADAVVLATMSRVA